MPTKTQLTKEQRLELIAVVLAKAYDETNTWRHKCIGAALAYLAHAIATKESIDLRTGSTDSTDKYALKQFRKWFPPEHLVWRFIKTDANKA